MWKKKLFLFKFKLWLISYDEINHDERRYNEIIFIECLICYIQNNMHYINYKKNIFNECEK